jgi:hypothetical protein
MLGNYILDAPITSDASRLCGSIVAMQWSKLRSAVRALICPELRKRVDFHVTSYRRSHDEAEKAWITIDGDAILTASWYRHQWQGYPRDAKGRLDPQGEFPAETDRLKGEVYLPQELGWALRAYLDIPIEDARNSSNYFIRALSIIDRRTGKRSLDELKPNENDHSLVKEFYRLRTDAIKQT